MAQCCVGRPVEDRTPGPSDKTTPHTRPPTFPYPPPTRPSACKNKVNYIGARSRGPTRDSGPTGLARALDRGPPQQ
ncbi:hypothetical protein J6590_025712 [Homalodisca vitripennis]|nr:hypothetical protein J6590_025712 [Homalodisca vitripennis]